MEHRFSKREYFISCTVTLFFSGLVAVSFFDISTCPYRFNRGASSNASFDASARSLFVSLSSEGGIACHMVDLVLWIYIIALVLLMSHKYYYYRSQGFHYFFLDYCYFHNACLVLFLLWRLVDVEWSSEPVISWGAYVPQSWIQQHQMPFDIVRANDTKSSSPLVSLVREATPLANQTWATWAKGAFSSSLRNLILVSGVYKPVSVDIITTRHATLEVSTADQLLMNFLSFFTLVAGSFGPILGAILMWQNALLFHSFDRMSSSYLHLAPAVTQLLLLHGLFTTAQRELKTESLCHAGTLCHDLRMAVSYWPLLKLHAGMFMVWQLIYHVIHEGRRRHREKSHRKKLKLLLRRQEEFRRLTGSTEEEAEVFRPILFLSEGLGGDLTQRVTAYTWMMEHPPLGKKGPFYRFVTIFGTGRFPSTVMFQVAQWILHVVFFSIGYPAIYYSFHVSLAVWPLALYTMMFFLLCVYNAAKMNKKWVQKLQKMAEIGVEMHRHREVPVQRTATVNPEASGKVSRRESNKGNFTYNVPG